MLKSTGFTLNKQNSRWLLNTIFVSLLNKTWFVQTCRKHIADQENNAMSSLLRKIRFVLCQ